MQTIGERIKYLREARGLSQHELAVQTGLQRGNISHYERDKVKPSAEAIVQLASTLGVTSDWLLTGRQAIARESASAGVQERLRDLRLSRGLGEQDLGQCTGLSPDDVIAWETGELGPSTDELTKLAGFFGVSLDWLITGRSPSAPLPGASLGEDARQELRLFTEFLQYRQLKRGAKPEQGDDGSSRRGYREMVREIGSTYLPVFSAAQRVSPVLPDAAWEGFIPLDMDHPSPGCFAVRLNEAELFDAGFSPGDLLVVSFQEPPAPGEVALIRVGDRTVIGEWRPGGQVAECGVGAGGPPVLIGRIIQVRRTDDSNDKRQ